MPKVTASWWEAGCEPRWSYSRGPALTAHQYETAQGWVLLRVFRMLQQAGRGSQRRWHPNLGLWVEFKFTSNRGPSALGWGLDDARGLGMGQASGMAISGRDHGVTGTSCSSALPPVKMLPLLPGCSDSLYLRVSPCSRHHLLICPSSCSWEGNSDTPPPCFPPFSGSPLLSARMAVPVLCRLVSRHALPACCVLVALVC